MAEAGGAILVPIDCLPSPSKRPAMPLPGFERYVPVARRGSAPVRRRLRRRSSAVPKPYLRNGGERKGTAETRKAQPGVAGNPKTAGDGAELFWQAAIPFERPI